MPSAATPSAAPSADSSVLLVQLSDSHLFAEADGRLLGMDTCDSLQRVIALVEQEQPRIDLVLATGDLSQDGSLASYQRFRQLTDSLAPQVRWFPGNHDEPAAMQAACAGTALLDSVLKGKQLNEGETIAYATAAAVMGRISAYTGLVVRMSDIVKVLVNALADVDHANLRADLLGNDDGVGLCA